MLILNHIYADELKAAGSTDETFCLRFRASGVQIRAGRMQGQNKYNTFE